MATAIVPCAVCSADVRVDVRDDQAHAAADVAVFRCECGARTAHGVAMPRVVVEPTDSRFITLRVASDGDVREYKLDRQLAAAVANTILSVAAK